MRRSCLLSTPVSLEPANARDVAAAMNGILADVFALYIKTKNFHRHVSGPHFRDYHLLLDDQADQIFAMTDPIAERVRKLGELAEDNRVLATSLRRTHNICDKNGDIATASVIEAWVDEAQRRNWFLYEASRDGDLAAH